METKLGQEPAFPVENKHVFNPKYNGMSKRFYAACMILQSLLTTQKNYNEDGFDDDDTVYYTEIAYEFADELIKQENE